MIYIPATLRLEKQRTKYDEDNLRYCDLFNVKSILWVWIG